MVARLPDEAVPTISSPSITRFSQWEASVPLPDKQSPPPIQSSSGMPSMQPPLERALALHRQLKWRRAVATTRGVASSRRGRDEEEALLLPSTMIGSIEFAWLHARKPWAAGSEMGSEASPDCIRRPLGDWR